MKSKKQNVLKRSKVSSGCKIVIFSLLCVFFCTIISFTPIKIQSITKSGVDITYEVDINNPPNAAINITATYKNITSPLKLEISYPNWSAPTLKVFKDLRFFSSDGKSLNWKKVDYRTIEITTNENLVSAIYSINLDVSKTYIRDTKVEDIGGVINGSSTFPVPITQKVNSAKVKITVPEPWKVVSTYPEEDSWFVIKPYTFEDLSLEILASGWYFGNIDFDYTKVYDDRFEIRVVGFKYVGYEHWSIYLGNTPLEEALKSADFYHKTYLRIKEIYGEYPLPKLLLVGPGFWQAGGTYLRQQLVGWNRYEYIPHHMFHPFFQVRIVRSELILINIFILFFQKVIQHIQKE